MRHRRQQNAWIAPLVVFTLILLFALFMFLTWEVPRPDYIVERTLPPMIFDGQNMPPPAEMQQD